MSPTSSNPVRPDRPFDFGAMWWLREELWVNIIPSEFRYRRNPRRDRHPGVSIFDEEGEPPQQLVPMLHGSSEPRVRDAVCVLGFDSHSPQQPTYFGHLCAPSAPPRPARVPRLAAHHLRTDREDFVTAWRRIFGQSPEQVEPAERWIACQPAKRMIDQPERASLRGFLHRRRLDNPEWHT